MKFISLKFIVVATLTYIPYTVLWFAWHNNMFHGLYYSVTSFYNTHEQNVWYMNFANALLVYGFVYFFRRSVKPDTRLINSVMWGIYYNISATGFYNFMLLGASSQWNLMILFHDLLWALFSGAFIGWLVNTMNKKFG